MGDLNPLHTIGVGIAVVGVGLAVGLGNIGEGLKEIGRGESMRHGTFQASKAVNKT